jgi:hypothetical protein
MLDFEGGLAAAAEVRVVRPPSFAPQRCPADARLAQALLRVPGCSDATFARACALLAPLRSVALSDLLRLYPAPESCPFTHLVRNCMP